ncbi:hypothetical protein [Oligoflexus tunisiensis]|uniref:hypothetical protein n=1 Tax=Oligoflexus tunisiensis TaxID=708132 RepID=UPI00114D1C9A|nr:hypothetical protein [Oligoflexus tunisiensis]
MDQRGFYGLGFSKKESHVVSFNLVFHVASALACVLLIYALLRLQGLVRFHGQLWQSLDPARKLVQLDWPALFLQKFGRALDIAVEGSPDKGQPCRIQMGPWVAAHLELRFTRIFWKSPEELLVETHRPDATGTWSQKLEDALGGAVRVQLQSFAVQSNQGV